MATSTPLAEPAEGSLKARADLPSQARSPLIYWHLLSLDAPSVAMVWTWFIARASGIHLPPASILAMGIAVWALYAADRLLDAHTLLRPRRKAVILSAAKDPDDRSIAHNSRTFPPQAAASGADTLELRHLFHHHHQRPYLTAIGLAAIALAFLIPQLPTPALLLYAIQGILLAAYFLLIHLKQDLAPRLPKEIAVGIFFSAATFIPTVARNPALRPHLLPSAVLFGVVCSLNCLFIYAWEHPSPYPEAHASTRLILRVLLQLSTAIMLTGFALSVRMKLWQLPAATSLAATLLLLLHANKRKFTPTTLRATADLCLLTPILFALTLPS